MTTYRLYANVNPLEPNCLVCIAKSTDYALSPIQAKHHLISKGKELKAKGFRVSMDLTMTKKIEI